jgi:SPP1 gp7 family putative phage head morphogenesis protein
VDDIDVDDPDVTGEEEIGVGGTVALPTLSLNGSQISSLIEILLLVATEQLPRDSGLNLIMIAFNIDADSAEDIMGDIGATFFIEEPVDVDAGKVARASLKQRVLSKAAGPVQKISEKDIPRIVNRITPEQIGKKAAPVLKDAVKHFGARAIVEVGSDITFNMRSPKVERFLKSWAGDRIGKKVNATTKDALRSALVEGVKAGESTKQLSARVAGVFDDARSWRSDAIARTEMGRASNFGSLEGMVQAGIEEKEWLTTQDDQTRDSHSDMDGQVVAIDAEFESPNGGTAQYPGDFGEAEEDANCRCTVLSHVGKASRGAQWKATEAERKPFDKALRRALRLGFDAQETAVRAAL